MCAARKVPAASLALFNTLSIILLIPVYDRGLVPLLRRSGTKLTLLSRIGEAQGLGLRAALTSYRMPAHLISMPGSAAAPLRNQADAAVAHR